MRVRILSVAALAALFALTASSALAKTKLTYANFPPASTFPCVQMEEWKAQVEKQTDAVEIQTFPGSTLLDAKGMMDGVLGGVADIGCLAFPYQPGRFPLIEAIDLPIGFTSSSVANAVFYDLVQKYQPESLKGVKVLALFTAPPAQIMTKDPIRSVADLKGYKLRATPAGVEPLKLLDAAPVAMPMSDTPEALQKGTVNGVFSSTDVLKDFNFAKNCRYLTISDMQTTAFGVVMNLEKWNALPDEVKKVFDDLSRSHSMWVGKYVDDHGTESVEWSKKEHGLEVIELPADEYKLWHEKVKPISDAWITKATEKGLPAQTFFDEMLTLKAKYEKEGAK